MLEPSSADKPRFFNAVAQTNCLLLQMSKDVFEYVMSCTERKILNDKIAFLRSLPEFKSTFTMQSTKIKQFCAALTPLSLIKGQTLIKEGAPNTKVFFVKAGEL